MEGITDHRLNWFKNVISTSLSIEMTVVDTFLESDERKNYQKLLEIVNSYGEENLGTIVLFYCLQKEEEVEIEEEPTSSEETISDEEEELSMDESESESEEIESGTPVSSYEEDLASTYVDYTPSSEMATTVMSSSESLKEASVTVKVDAPDEGHKKKIIKHVMTITVLYMAYCKVPYNIGRQDLVFFLRVKSSHIPHSLPREETWQTMNSHFETGFLSNFSIHTLSSLLKQIYLPFCKSGILEKSFLLLENELDGALNQVEHKIAQLADILEATNICISDQPTLSIPHSLLFQLEAGTGPESAQEFEDLISIWNELLTAVIANQKLMKLVEAHNFVGILQKWKENSSRLGFLVREIKSENVQTIIKIFRADGNLKLTTFLDLSDGVQKHFSVAEQNVEMLSLLQQQLAEINAAIEVKEPSAAMRFPHMIHSLRLLWTVSSYYSSENAMTLLLEKITEGISETACKNIRMQNLTETALSEVNIGVAFVSC